MPKPRYFIICLLLLCGCSKNHITAKFLIYRGEQNHYKAYQLKIKKNSVGERKKYYAKACDQFSRALELDASTFNYYQASYAYESCQWVENHEAAEKFGILLENLHEPSYGPDGGPGMMME